ncbi:hypothetical protein, conserved [Eimeria necatrix]|uniref:Uncharacterized protein n=1 Tax=Eimeria necatrix TaxID=51315 RepID=U6N076_9EIME|nr:hypothetical protein, conserved [Eimeria necatrix]CDJ68703.1 hypothetical protein, conserved [Eimeria necatrix]
MMCAASPKQFSNPSKVKIHQDRSAEGGLSASEVRKIWGQPSDAIFANVAESHFACLDDRITAPSLYTPGGDLGEFALALTACGTAPNDAAILQILNAHVAALPAARKFYHCTDDEALEHMESYLGLEGLDMFSPDPATQQEIIKAIEQPRNKEVAACAAGDSAQFSFFTSASSCKQQQAVHSIFVTEVCCSTSGLSTAVMKAFFTVLWDTENPNQQRMQLEVLAGKRAPQAFLEIATTEDCEAAGVAPLLRARGKQARALISHMNAVSARRKELAAFFTKNGFCSLSAEELASRMDRYGARLGRDLPFYRVSFI